MIAKQEIMDFAHKFSLPVNTIEKDYVLGWLLAGIANDTEIFEKWIYEEIGIEIIEDTIRFEIYQNNDGKTTVEGRLNYIGPLQRRNNPYRVKLDLTAEEILVLPPVLQNVHHTYSDIPSDKIKAFCYNFSEVFAEKIRALSERARPRDLYDVIHLYHHASGENPAIVFDVLQKKCKYKAISLPTMEFMTNNPKLHELESEWSNMLSHQVPMLPPKEQFWQELPKMFAWLHGVHGKEPVI